MKQIFVSEMKPKRATFLGSTQMSLKSEKIFKEWRPCILNYLPSTCADLLLSWAHNIYICSPGCAHLLCIQTLRQEKEGMQGEEFVYIDIRTGIFELWINDNNEVRKPLNCILIYIRQLWVHVMYTAA